MSEHDTPWEGLGERRVDRRGFVAGTAALIAAAGLGRIPEALAAPEAPRGELFYYNWAPNVNPKTYKDITKATGNTVPAGTRTNPAMIVTAMAASRRSLMGLKNLIMAWAP